MKRKATVSLIKTIPCQKNSEPYQALHLLGLHLQNKNVLFIAYSFFAIFDNQHQNEA